MGFDRRWDKNHRGRPTFGTDPNSVIPAEMDQHRVPRRVKLQGSIVKNNLHVADKCFLGQPYHHYNLLFVLPLFRPPFPRQRLSRETSRSICGEVSGDDPLPQICPGLENEMCGDQGSMSAKSLDPPGRLLTTFRLKSSDWQAGRAYGPFDTELASCPTRCQGSTAEGDSRNQHG